LKRDIPTELLELIEEDKHTPAELIFHLIQYIFLEESDEKILNNFLTVKDE
jgi:hypothetical protein